MANTPLEHKDIVKLLGELKEETPEYPVHMMSERKAAFLQKAIDIKISKEGDSGDKDGPKGGNTGAGGAGSSGPGMRDKPFFLGLTLNQTITIGVILVLLVAGYFMRDQISEVMTENGIVAEETTAPANGFTMVATPTHTPAPKSSLGGSAGDSEDEHSFAEDSEETTKPPGKSTGSEVGEPTPPARHGPAEALRFLFCILRFGGKSCQ